MERRSFVVLLLLTLAFGSSILTAVVQREVDDRRPAPPPPDGKTRYMLVGISTEALGGADQARFAMGRHEGTNIAGYANNGSLHWFATRWSQQPGGDNYRDVLGPGLGGQLRDLAKTMPY